jgi:septum formation protein
LSTGFALVLILASASAIRSQMLSAAGVGFQVVPAAVDEGAVKAAGDDPQMLAARLAEVKALAVSANHPADWVIGGDSIVTVDGRRFDKPRSRDEAAEHLRLFSGRTMLLTSAVALAREGRVDWSQSDTPELRVRSLSEDYIQTYLAAEWPSVGACVGVFRMEALGVQLFEAVEGSHFTILGMPLIPLLNALRARGVLAS